MAELSKIRKNGVDYDIKDATAREALKNFKPSASVELDTSLTQSGKAADAKAVGDKIAEMTGISLVEPAEDDIPKLYFTGTLPTTKTEDGLQLNLRYISKTADFTYPVTLNVQGGSSTMYAKKNFTMKLFKDSGYESKQKLAFKNWPEMNKFVLKAHWVDHSHIRNVGAAKLFGNMVRSRADFEELPEELRTAPNNGATDGFTVKLFANGIYQGLYELIVPKDKLFGQDDDIPTHSILNSGDNSDPSCAFATTTPRLNSWEEELQESLTSDIANSFSNLIKFVAGSTDEEFIANAENYMDVLSVIDFDIFARIFCVVDNLCKNQIFFTYDGVKWYEGGWDFDCIAGLTPSLSITPADTPFQEGYFAYKNHGVTNMLYKRVEENFLARFKERYWELREGVFSAPSIIDVFERLADTIAHYSGLLEEDYAKTTAGGAFTGVPLKDTNNIQQIRNWIVDRLVYMDGVITNMVEPVSCTGITLNTNTLEFDAFGVTQKLTATVTPQDTSDIVVWNSSNNSVATVTQDGVVKSVGNGSATITATCGNQTATCTVTVSGFTVPNILDGIVWSQGQIWGGSVNIGSSEKDIHTDWIDITSLNHIYAEYEFGGKIQIGASRIVFANASGGYVKDYAPTSDAAKGAFDLDIPDGATSVAFSIYINTDNGNGFKGIVLRETAGGDVIGEIPYPNPA